MPAPRGVIDAAIGRDPRNPLRFKVSTTESAKPARTHYARIDSTRCWRRKFHGWRAGWKRVARIKSACTLSILAIR